jgi:hypothetical protein
MDWPWNPWNIHRIRESMWTSNGLPGGVISPPKEGQIELYEHHLRTTMKWEILD